ncbi:helix-turn-helix domain-containing protein [Micromonospora inyonensis]|uniref:Helix-turn-helix domain-containing protein n=1 Tax=Micromonospora inyonensis TaxID=47866 RepID=A0A1C6S5H0_9ACTN|nr:helix-turn-helix transcriptional regulator [Micromonospora inyonensis]SCL24711.1 Helix-turn-helix domain-containing protein [Micromonospora inyonensis]
MIDRQQLQEAREALGRMLATRRKARGMIQSEVARAVFTTRSTVGMVERGRQIVDRVFWQQCESVLSAGGELVAAYDAYRQLERQFRAEQESAARKARWGALANTDVPGPVLTTALPDKADLRQPPADADRRDDAPSRLLAELRRHLLAPAASKQTVEPTTLSEVRQRVAHVHSLYQRGNYAETVRALPDTLEQAHLLTRTCTDTQRLRAAAILAAANLAAAKLAVKLGDPSLAWVAADRAACIAADQTEDAALVAATAFSVGTALLAMPNRVDDAEEVVLSALGRVRRDPVSTRPRVLSTRGALTLLAGLIAARQAQPAAAGQHLDDAYALARLLGSDRNDLWTGFGPTNVMIHRISIAARTDRPQLAIHLGERLDTSSLPAALVSRRAQVHLDLAAAYATSPDNDPAAVLHLLEAERIAPQKVHTHGRTRRMIGDLLARERRAITPGLRALAERAEVTA